MRSFWTSVHALRGLAALLVVLHHIPLHLQPRLTDTYVPAFNGGAAGVDIFFAISGFVMFYTTGRPGANWRRFLVSRITRVVPLYWAMTLALAALVFLVPAIFPTFTTDLTTVLKSLFFIPVYDLKGDLRPLLHVGWTLYFEMFFYALTALAMLAHSKHGAVLSAVFLALASILANALGAPTGNSMLILLSPIVIEFLFGVAIGAFSNSQVLRDMPPLARRLLGVAALAIGVSLLFGANAPADIRWHRLSTWGVAGALLLLGAVMLEDELARAPLLARITRPFGDSSYALYLTHGFAFSIVYRLFASSSPSLLQWAFLLLAGALIVGQLTHLLIEKRLNHVTQKLLGGFIKGS